MDDMRGMKPRTNRAGVRNQTEEGSLAEIPGAQLEFFILSHSGQSDLAITGWT